MKSSRFCRIQHHRKPIHNVRVLIDQRSPDAKGSTHASRSAKTPRRGQLQDLSTLKSFNPPVFWSSRRFQSYLHSCIAHRLRGVGNILLRGPILWNFLMVFLTASGIELTLHQSTWHVHKYLEKDDNISGLCIYSLESIFVTASHGAA